MKKVKSINISFNGPIFSSNHQIKRPHVVIERYVWVFIGHKHGNPWKFLVSHCRKLILSFPPFSDLNKEINKETVGQYLEGHDVYFSAFGTTRKVAGSAVSLRPSKSLQLVRT